MGHGHSPKPPKPITRDATPVMGKLGGKDVLMCPYCDPPHPISTQEVSPCGTVLEVRAIQAVFKGQKCALCGQTNGHQIMAGSRFVHTPDCTPGKKMYAVAPDKSAWAAVLWRFPDWVQLWVARKFGKVVMELRDKDDEVSGYAWQTVSKHAKSQIAVSGRGNSVIGQGDPNPS